MGNVKRSILIRASFLPLPPALQPVLAAQATVALPQPVALAPRGLQLAGSLDLGALPFKLLVERPLLLQVVALGAQRAQPRLPVEGEAYPPARGAHRLDGERAVDPARAYLHGAHRVGYAAAPRNLGGGEGRAVEAHLAQDVVLLLGPPYAARLNVSANPRYGGRAPAARPHHRAVGVEWRGGHFTSFVTRT